MKKYFSLIFVFVVLFPIHSNAEIYKRVDPDGRVTYSNVKTKGATRLDLDPDTNTISNDRAKSIANKHSVSPEGFPKIDKQTQVKRDDKRQDILKSELESEKEALDQAKKAFEEGQSNPDIYRTADGKILRNVPKFQEKMKNLQAEVDTHQKNIELLQKELDALH